MERKNQYVLITGATSGIGYELAKLFAKNGYDLVIVARNHEELEVKAEEFKKFGVNVISISKNLFLEEEAYSLYADLKLNGISPSILINDAGQGAYGQFHDTDIHREIDIIKLNIISVLILTKLFLKDRVPQGSGKILNLASVASKAPGPWHSVYHGTKSFILSWSEAIREELKDSGITVTALLPGPTDTDFFNKADMTDSKVLANKDNLASPEEVAFDGYNGLMNGNDKVVSGLQNKVTVAMTNLSSDSMAAQRMGEMQEPIGEK
ncbi:SDR family oxidoreductase [Chryseobacterium sp. ISL-6]|uniref:SDR family NAD(P)-dependent oxidoreductase n=1 Tax=Chryseobacterium sp. ISL-6 TaxID=2819143 RepID=UPI001BE5509E|nr:SDR family oxidoreductase [Chryseobacterium sp. ISL-6]MBT2620105.1 SDR family oxidoreductase [Chryseobacterium sp. ISL-6]